MDFNNKLIGKIRQLIVFTVVLIVVLINYKVVFSAFSTLLGILFPFILGGALAFIINVPMQFIEHVLFTNRKIKDKRWVKRTARPLSLLISFILIIGVLLLVIFVVVPELASSTVNLASQISEQVPKLQTSIEGLFKNNENLSNWFNNLQVDWSNLVEKSVEFLRTGATNILSSTFSIAKSIVSAVVNFFIAVVFACYIVLQKEKLSLQLKKLLYAFLPQRGVGIVLKVSSVSYKTFFNFIRGQCLEALILGLMFFVSMSILQFPYALLIGILITVTALVPILGSFIGCVVGAFLILIVNPLQAVFFIILFLVLQQIEGNLIYPHVVGNSVGLPSIWVLVAVTLGGSLMGIAGILIFIPLVSIIYTLLREYVNNRLKKRGINVEKAK
ncbi:MAG: AI-2E family transporter [Lachnospiraceae bacterium]